MNYGTKARTEFQKYIRLKKSGTFLYVSAI